MNARPSKDPQDVAGGGNDQKETLTKTIRSVGILSIHGGCFTMRQILIATYVLVCCFSSSQAWAQTCKPDLSGVDKISKAPVEAWMQVLFSGLTSGNSEVQITAVIGRMGAANELDLRIWRRQEAANAGFESDYRGAIGKSFYFGFKNGDPLEFVVKDVGFESGVQQGLYAAKGVTTAILAAYIPDGALAAMREALVSRQIDAIRIPLAGGVRIEESVGDKNGKKMMEKFSCFYQALDKRGIDLSAGANAQGQPGQPASVSDAGGAASVQGKYVRKGKSSDFMEFRSDGTCSAFLDGNSISGNFKVQGDTLTITSPQEGGPATAHVSGNTVTFSSGNVYERQAEQKLAAQLTIDQIIQMVAAKLPDDIIITTIRNSGSKFDLTPDTLIKLKTAGVSDAVIRAMTR